MGRVIPAIEEAEDRRWIDVEALTGAQIPRISNIPPAIGTKGLEVIELLEMAGRKYLPWQKFSINSILSYGENRKWIGKDACILCARQNGKTDIIEARIIGGIYLFGERDVVYSAHREETAIEIMERLNRFIQTSPILREKFDRPVVRNGFHTLRFINGARIRFKTRSAGSGRGLGGDLIVLDEAWNLRAELLGALTPAIRTKRNPQVVIGSTAVDKTIHPYGEELARFRRRAMEEELDPYLVYLEWSAETGPDPDNPIKDMPLPLLDMRNVREANPSLGNSDDSLISEETVKAESKRLGTREFAVEILNIGWWPPAPGDQKQNELLPVDRMRAHVVEKVEIKPDSPVCLALDMSPDRRWLTVAAATKVGSHGIHVEVGRHEAPTPILTRYIISLIHRWNPVALVIDGKSNAMATAVDLKAVGLEPQVTTAAELAQATGGFADDVVYAESDILSFYDDPLIMEANASAMKRDIPGGWALNRGGSADISPMVAIMLARYGLLAYLRPEEKSTGPYRPTVNQQKPKSNAASAVFNVPVSAADGVDILRAQF